MFTNERLFTIQAFTITRVHCIYIVIDNLLDLQLIINPMPFFRETLQKYKLERKNQVKKREKRYIDIVLQIEVNTISEFLSN